MDNKIVYFVNQMMKYEEDRTGKPTTLDYDDIVVENIYNLTGFISREKIRELYEANEKSVDATMDKVFEEYR